MALLFRIVTASVLASCFTPVHTAPTAGQDFKNDLSIAALFISNPYQADVTSSYNSTLSGTSDLPRSGATG